jgi:hypothetical protein
MGVVNEAVEDGVGVSRVANEGVPFVDRDLAGEDGRAAPIAFLEDLVEVTTSTGVERFESAPTRLSVRWESWATRRGRRQSVPKIVLYRLPVIPRCGRVYR